MIRVVLDTNVVISGTLWSGTPHLVIQAALEGKIKPIASEIMLDELQDVIGRPKFAERLRLIRKTAAQIVEDYAALAEIVETANIEAIVVSDPDDDYVLACAVSGQANYVVSGDPHLLEVHQHNNILILSASELMSILARESNEDRLSDDL